MPIARRFFRLQDGKWVQVAEFEEPPSSALRPPSSGLGDRVAALAQPIARALDRALGTNLAECGGCKNRQAALNKLVPKL